MGFAGKFIDVVSLFTFTFKQLVSQTFSNILSLGFL